MATADAIRPDSPLFHLTTWQHQPSVYGPIADGLMALGGLVGKWLDSPLWAAGFAYKLLTLALDVGGLFLARALVRGEQDASRIRGFALLALNPLLAWEVVGQAHNDGLIVFGALVYLFAMDRKRDALGVFGLAFGTLSKFMLAPTLAFYLRVVARTNWKRAALLALMALALAIVCYLPLLRGVSSLDALKPGVQTNEVRQAVSLYTVLWRVLRVLHLGEAWHMRSFIMFTWIGRLVVLAVALPSLWRVRTIDDVNDASILIFLALICTSATLATWYFLWLLPFAVVVRQRGYQVLTLGLCLTACLAPSLVDSWLVLPGCQLAGLAALWRVRGGFSIGATT